MGVLRKNFQILINEISCPSFDVNGPNTFIELYVHLKNEVWDVGDQVDLNGYHVVVLKKEVSNLFPTLDLLVSFDRVTSG